VDGIIRVIIFILYLKVISMMKDSDKTTFAFVMYPEKTPIIEAYRASQELKSAGIETQMVVANLIIPEEQATTDFFKNRRYMQEKYLQEIRNTFNTSKVVRVPMYDKEIIGLKMLKYIGETIF
jgi:arsenite-transporting ATPase